ncbi:NEL domain-containing protein [Pseudomonas sp. MWU13-2105]|uniref:NEL domain-containing protein n=1 Tax=Pseudomonas sp. MWU13-2105 TaxID=2935074 RepID=UPI00200FF9F3|nr:NEL domain-containing protein [Pseudomonas sp. MWU13-2105]
MVVSTVDETDVSAPLEVEDYYASVERWLPGWLKKASARHRRSYVDNMRLQQADKTRLAAYLQGLQTPEAFAAPRLQEALDKAFGPGLDIQRDRLRHVHILAAQTLSTPYQESVTEQTLLQASLQNFEKSETADFGFDRGSEIIRDSRGVLKTPLTLQGFARLCRRLDLGGQYKEHIESFLLRKNTSGQRGDEFRRLFLACETSELALQADIALMKGHIDEAVYRMLKGLVGGDPRPFWGSDPVACHDLKLLNVAVPESGYRGALLKGVLLICSESRQSAKARPCVVYLSGDPEQALKQYPNLTAFEDELRVRLRNLDYQRSFRRYIHLRTQPFFFTALNERLNPLRPGVRQQLSDQRADLQLQTAPLFADLFTELYTQHLVKILDDARVLAVSTDEEDKKSRRARWQAFLNWGVNLLFFVPGLGEAMLAVAGAQLLVQLYEGIEEWEHGDKKQAVLTFLGVVLTLELGAFMQGLGHNSEAAAFINRLKRVKVPGGDTRLWQADLKPYRHTLELPEGLKPDESGLHRHGASTYLPFEGAYYKLKPGQLANEFRAEHPVRSSYEPLFRHNGSGAWVHELEDPLSWDECTLFERLGADFKHMTWEQVGRIMSVSGVEADALRPVYLDQMKTPALLSDTLARFRVNADIQRFIETGSTNGGLVDWRIQEQLLETLWPSSRVLRFLDGEGGVLKEYGPADKTHLPVLSISARQIRAGHLLEQVQQGLAAQEIDTILGRRVDAPPLSAEQQRAALSRRLADEAQNQRSALFENYYEFRTRSTNPFVALLRRQFPGLPTAVADEVASAANGYEVELLEAGKVPLRLAEESHWYLQQVRIARAYEGMFLESSVSLDADRLSLHSLENLPGWSQTWCIELYEPSELAPGGLRLIDRLGAPASAEKRLVLVRQSNGYVMDGELGPTAPPPQGLYATLLRVLPDTALNSLGYSRTTPARQLERAVVQRLKLSRTRIRALLHLPAIKPGFRSPMRLSDGRFGYPLGGQQTAEQVLPSHLLRLVDKLYPGQGLEEVRRFLAVEGQDDKVFLMALKRRHIEYQKLKLLLEYWRVNPEYESDRGGVGGWHINTVVKRAAVERIKRCWRRESQAMIDSRGRVLGHELDLSGINLLKLPELEEDFDHVVSLKLSLVGLRDRHDLNEFLKHFPKLRRLQITGGRLVQLPASLGQMSELSNLQLNGNRIAWTQMLGAQLRSLRLLRRLNLNGNPLGTFDARGMPGLRALQVQRSELIAWPVGVLELLDLMLLDIQGNRLTSLPGDFYALSSQRMRTVLLYGNPLDEVTQQNITLFRDRPSIRFTLPGETGLVEGVPDLVPVVENWLDSSFSVAEQERRRTLWDLVAHEPGHETFLSAIAALRQSADYRLEFRAQLTRRVWRMIEAAARDTQLRQALFDWTSELETCADGFTEVFSRLGAEVLLYEARGLTGQARERAYLQLAEGRARLGRLNDIAQVETANQEILRSTRIEQARTEAMSVARARQAGAVEIAEAGRLAALAANERWPDIDEVEIFLAYRVDLAKRLRLPWQPLSMLYRGASNVSRDMTGEAGTRVLAAENTLEKRIALLLEQPLWMDYLEERPEVVNYAAAAQQHLSALEDLRAALEDLARQPQAAAQERAEWMATVQGNAATLGIAREDIPVDQEMSDAVYMRTLEAIAGERKNGLEQLTREALARVPAGESFDL